MTQDARSESPALDAIVEQAETWLRDSTLAPLAVLKARGVRVVGCVPAYVPTEIIDASGAVAAYIIGGTPTFEVMQGDSYFQSAICHIPRSLIELGLRGSLDALDLIVMPSTCDVMRNLTGMWKMIWPERRVRFLDLPHRYDEVGFSFYRRELVALAAAIEDAVGSPVTEGGLRRAIATANRRRRLLAELEELRTAEPWRVRTSELWLLIRAGALMSPVDHVELLLRYLAACRSADRPPMDVARVVLHGAFCEQPPLGFLRTLERAGCAIVADDLLLGMRWLRKPVDETIDPYDALARAYLDDSPLASCRFEGDGRRPEELLRTVRATRAAGVVYATPSFCDPPLLDRPAVLEVLEKAGVPCVQLQYAENSVDFGSVREQAGTFADALRLWEVA